MHFSKTYKFSEKGSLWSPTLLNDAERATIVTILNNFDLNVTKKEPSRVSIHFQSSIVMLCFAVVISELLLIQRRYFIEQAGWRIHPRRTTYFCTLITVVHISGWRRRKIELFWGQRSLSMCTSFLLNFSSESLDVDHAKVFRVTQMMLMKKQVRVIFPPRVQNRWNT